MTTAPSAGLRRAPGTRALLVWFGRLVARRRAACAGIVLAMVVQLGFQLAVAHGLQVIIDGAIPQRDVGLLLAALLALALAFALGLAAALWQARTQARLATSALRDLAARLFTRVLRMSSASRRQLPAAEVLSRLTTDLKAIEQGLQVILPVALQNGIFALGALAAVVAIEWRVALATLLGAPIALAGAHLLTPRAARASEECAADQARVTAVVEESLGAQPAVQALGVEPVFDARFDAEARRAEASGARLAFLSHFLGATSEYGVTLLVVAIIGVGAALAISGSLTTGALVACCSLLLNAGWAASAVGDALAGLTRLGGSVARLDDLAERAEPLPQKPDPVPLPPLTRAIRFEAVRFGYDDRVALDGVSFEIPAGSWVAFVGPSGSGKSSVLRLLLRLEDPWAGRVTWDDTPVDAVRLDDLRRQVGLVPQDPVLLDWSLRENIRLGAPAAGDDAIAAAARAAELHAVIEALPDGYETRAGERGGGLSGGQRQRLALARALVRDPRLLVLDEATSALDAETEARINATLERVARGRTVVSVTHRLESVRRADRIFVLEAGRVVEAGAHDELLARGGRYRSLYEKQSGFTEGADGNVQVTAERLRRVPLLESLSLEVLEPLARHFVTERFEAGQAVFRQGARGDRFYIVVRGRVEVEREGRRFAVLLDGDHFGEIALLEGVRRQASVVAQVPTVCLSLTRQRFWELLLPHEGVREALVRQMQERISAIGTLDRDGGVTLADPEKTII